MSQPGYFVVIAGLRKLSRCPALAEKMILRQLRIVRYRKEGRMAYYRLDDACVVTLLQKGLDHVRE